MLFLTVYAEVYGSGGTANPKKGKGPASKKKKPTGTRAKTGGRAKKPATPKAPTATRVTKGTRSQQQALNI